MNNDEHNQTNFPTVGQLERELSQKISGLYYSQLGHRASKVECHLLDNKFVIFSEGITTLVEKSLQASNSIVLQEKVRAALDASIKSELEQLIYETTQVKVNDLMHCTAIKTDCAVAVAILASAPQVRYNKSNLRNNNHKKDIIDFTQSPKKIEYSH